MINLQEQNWQQSQRRRNYLVRKYILRAATRKTKYWVAKSRVHCSFHSGNLRVPKTYFVVNKWFLHLYSHVTMHFEDILKLNRHLVKLYTLSQYIMTKLTAAMRR